MSTANTEQKIAIAKAFVDLHKAPFKKWSITLNNSNLSEDTLYEQLFHEILGGALGDCRALNPEFDDEDDCVKEATEFEIEIPSHQTKSGHAEVFHFTYEETLEDSDSPSLS